jgi:hypothetical protein
VRAYRRRLPTCQEMVELVTDYLEDSLSRWERRRFEAHVSGCDHCTEYLGQIRTTIALIGTVTVDDLTTTQQNQLMALVLRWCSEYR